MVLSTLSRGGRCLSYGDGFTAHTPLSRMGGKGLPLNPLCFLAAAIQYGPRREPHRD